MMLWRLCDNKLLVGLQAKRLFQNGVEMEKSGKLYEAIQFYRRAVQLVPDIEFKLHDASKAKQKENTVVVENDKGISCFCPRFFKIINHYLYIFCFLFYWCFYWFSFRILSWIQKNFSVCYFMGFSGLCYLKLLKKDFI